MTIEEKLRLTIYEANATGIITESDKDKILSYIIGNENSIVPQKLCPVAVEDHGNMKFLN